jgi:hypothetical protein
LNWLLYSIYVLYCSQIMQWKTNSERAIYFCFPENNNLVLKFTHLKNIKVVSTFLSVTYTTHYRWDKFFGTSHVVKLPSMRGNLTLKTNMIYCKNNDVVYICINALCLSWPFKIRPFNSVASYKNYCYNKWCYHYYL